MLAVLGTICALVIGLAGPATADPGPSVKLKITLDMGECDLMYVGTVGSCIISLQTWMNWAVGTKQTRIPVNGVYTEQTRVLVATFQRKYVPGIVPNGKFGDRSRAALRAWFVRGASRSGSSGVPCNTALGWGCASGAAVSGLNLGGGAKAGKSVFCGGVGALLKNPVGVGVGVFCDLVLD
jgi:hypothetical protein